MKKSKHTVVEAHEYIIREYIVNAKSTSKTY